MSSQELLLLNNVLRIYLILSQDTGVKFKNMLLAVTLVLVSFRIGNIRKCNLYAIHIIYEHYEKS